MDVSMFIKLMGSDMTEEDANILLQRAARLAINWYWWGANDKPTEEEIEDFLGKYEFEIYDVAKAMQSDADHDGEISHTELGITRVWSKSDNQTVVDKALSALPRKTYFWSNS